MMTVKLQIVVGLAILFILAILINMIRRRSRELKYALVWILVLTALFDGGIVPPVQQCAYPGSDGGTQ